MKLLERFGTNVVVTDELSDPLYERRAARARRRGPTDHQNRSASRLHVCRESIETDGLDRALPFPDRPSIAVLPFTNRSGDAQQDYFADGISEDLITSLSKFAGLFVIARHSAFRYRGTDLDVRQIGRELGVRYLLVGSVRRDAERIRITAQLVDAENTAQLWAEYYDRELTGIFAVQDEVTQKIVGTLIAHISRSEFERALVKAARRIFRL